MTNDKPIHIVLRVKKKDVDYSISEWGRKKDYVWWSYKGEKSPISDEKIVILNENINLLNSSMVYFCDENGEYIKKAELLSVEGKGTKTEEANHIPKGWGGEAELWLKCDIFEEGNFDDLKSFVYYTDETKTYLKYDPSKESYSFRNQNAVTMVIPKKVSSEKSVWRIALGENSFFWPDCRKGGFVVIGWSGLGDLSNIKNIEELKNIYLKKGWGNAYKAGKACRQIWDYIKNVRIGDIVLVRKGRSKILGIGEITSDYYVDFNRDCRVTP